MNQRSYIRMDIRLVLWQTKYISTSWYSERRSEQSLLHFEKINLKNNLKHLSNHFFVCVHGDGPRALDFANKIRAALEAEGVEICPLAQLI